MPPSREWAIAAPARRRHWRHSQRSYGAEQKGERDNGIAEGPDVDLRLGAATVARPELLPMPDRPSAEQHQCQDDQYKAHGYKVDRDRDGIDAAHGRRWQLWIIYRQLHLLFVLPPREVSPFNSTPRRQ